MKSTTNRPRILIVDDDESYLRILSRRLQRMNYEVSTARNGREALEKATKRPPDLVISDWMMPEMNGEEFCRTLKQDDRLRWVYFIMLTARGGIEDLVTGLEGGADDFLTKPCDDRELMARVRTGLRIVALQRENARLQRIEAINQMAVTVNHEINNPLAAISGYAELVLNERDRMPPEMTDKMEAIIHAVYRIRQVTRKLENLIEPTITDYAGGEMTMIDLEKSKAQGLKKILVVDDDDSIRYILVKMIGGFGHAVEGASDGEKALKFLKKDEFDLVLTDMKMPGLGGVELLRTIKKEAPKIPVVLITGFDEKEAIQLTRSGIADGFLAKPFRQKKIEEMLNRVLG